MSNCNCSIALIGTRWFICIAHEVFPVDRIFSIDTAYPTTDYDTDVWGIRIWLTNPEEDLIWTKDSDAKAIREFLIGLGLNVASDDDQSEQTCN